MRLGGARCIAPWLALCGCPRPSDPPSPPTVVSEAAPAPNGGGTSIRLTFDTSTSAYECTIAFSSEFWMDLAGVRSDLRGRMRAVVSVAMASSDIFGLRLDEISSVSTTNGQIARAFHADAHGTKTRIGELIETSSVADDVVGRREVDLLLGDPHSFVRLDERARVTAHWVDFSPALVAAGKDLDIAPTWLLTMPVLPGRAAVGDCWVGTRAVAMIEEDGRRAAPWEVELTYCLTQTDAGFAVVSVAGDGRRTSHAASTTQGPIEWSLRGEATVLRAGGRLVVGHIDGAMTSRTASGGFTMEMTCETGEPSDSGA